MDYSSLILPKHIKYTIGHDLIYQEFIEEFSAHPQVLSMMNYPHHGHIDCLSHSVHVSYTAYKVGEKLGLDTASLARGGLLHDFYLYDWHKKINRSGFHGFTHSKTAFNNASRLFKLNQIEENIIKTHMWPMNLKPPMFKESFIVMLVDKYCALVEIFFHRSPPER